MIKHIVLFKLKEFETQELKEAKLQEIKNALEGLVSKIDVLISMEVGLNVNPSEGFDFALVSEFANIEDVDVYAKHPDHVAVAKIIGEVRESRAGIDFIVK